jgi:hypothetical protein
MRQEKTQFESRVGVKGILHLRLFGPDGKLKEERIVHNTITNLMDAHVADQMSDQAEAAIGYMSIGTGSGQGAADTGLATVLDRNALTSTTQQAGADDNDVLYVCDWAAGDGTGAITEAGIFRADDDATMMTYADFAVVNKGAADTLQINWTVTFGAS